MNIADDPRFASLLSKPELAIDKTDQRFKPSPAMDQLLGKMREKRPALHVAAPPQRKDTTPAATTAAAAVAPAGSLDALVKSVKSKAADKLKKTKGTNKSSKK